MREITKNLSLSVGDETLTFRLSKLDAFSDGRLLKLFSVPGANPTKPWIYPTFSSRFRMPQFIVTCNDQRG